MISVIDIVCSVLGLTCVFLAGRNSKYNFWVGYLYSIALFVMFWQKNLYANLLLQPISLAINALGHWRWSHPNSDERSAKDENSLKVSMLGWAERIIALVSVLVVAVAWGYILDSLFPADPHPYIDTCVTSLILMAQLLSSMKKWDCWVAWLLVNVAQLIMHISVGHIFMPIVCTLYLGNGIWSLITWKKLYNKGE